MLTSSVVYQTVSNFGDKGNPHLESLLADLQTKGLIDSLVFYEPYVFTEEERETLITDANSAELGGPKQCVANQFLNEGSTVPPRQ